MNIIPQLYDRFNVLVPNPLVSIYIFDDYDSRVWNDPRPEPTLEQVLAVTQVQLDALMLDPNNVNTDKTKLAKLDFQVKYDMESRMRVLEGKPAITKVQYLTALVAVYKTL